MSIKPLNPHYALTAAASVVDEEAMTALELAGRTVGKVNECVEYINTAVDKLPADVQNTVNEHIENGDFDKAIDTYIGYLRQRLTVLENNYTPGGTTADAALYDLKIDVNGRTHSTPGDAVRANQKGTMGVIQNTDLNAYNEKSGYYVCVAGGLTNSPSTVSGILDVQVVTTSLSGSNIWVTQKWYDAAKFGLAYFRHFYNHEWSPWHQMATRFDKNWFNYINTDVDELTGNFYGIALNTAVNAPAEETALFESQEYSSTAGAGTVWTRQTWTGIDSGRVFERVKKPTNVWTPWRLMSGNGDNHILSGKTVVFLGDSILGNNQTGSGVVNLFSTMSGALCHNFAFGGTRVNEHSTQLTTWAALDGENLIPAIISGDFTRQDNAIATATDFPGYFKNSLNNLKAFDFTTADYIIINWGTNDWTSNSTVDEYTEKLDAIIESLSAAYPNAVIIKIKPTQRFAMYNGVMVDSNTPEAFARRDGVTLQEYVAHDDTLKNLYNIQVIDAFNIGINRFNALGFFDADDLTHHNAKGRERLAAFLAGSII
jgi:lysophospholipase L1-like esterase